MDKKMCERVVLLLLIGIAIPCCGGRGTDNTIIGDDSGVTIEEGDGSTSQDTGGSSSLACTNDFDCTAGKVCKNGVCTPYSPDNDASTGDAAGDANTSNEDTGNAGDTDGDSGTEDVPTDTGGQSDDGASNACNNDSDCSSDAQNPHCNQATGECVQCMLDEHCPGSLKCVSHMCSEQSDGGATDAEPEDNGVQDTGPEDTGTTDTGTTDVGAGDECGADIDCAGTAGQPYCVGGYCVSCVAAKCAYGQLCDTSSGLCETMTQCSKTSDCTGAQVCSIISEPDSTNKSPFLGCRDVVGTGTYGSACQGNADCRTNFCLDNKCSEPCVHNSDCTSAGCFAIPVTFSNGQTADIHLCAPYLQYCDQATDCVSNTACGLYDSADELLIGCIKVGGSKKGGETCTKNEDCQTYACVTATPSSFCFEPCQTDNDCSDVAGSKCQAEITITSQTNHSRKVQACSPGS